MRVHLSPCGNTEDIARRLFASLRWMDAQRLDHLYVEPCELIGLGVAIMDRLRRCAAGSQPAEEHHSDTEGSQPRWVNAERDAT